jgi:hypothetical protein
MFAMRATIHESRKKSLCTKRSNNNNGGFIGILKVTVGVDFSKFLHGGDPFARAMSALGHKQTFREVQTMSALPPIADIGSDGLLVRAMPEATYGQSNHACARTHERRAGYRAIADPHRFDQGRPAGRSAQRC